MYYTYIVKCSDGTYYSGITNDVAKRLAAHNGLVGGGAKYTRGRRPVRLLWHTVCESKGEALRLEMQLKKMSKKQKEMYMQSHGFLEEELSSKQ